MKILVTGARGFIGGWVCRRLDQIGADWQAFQGDVCRFEDFAVYRDRDTVIHLAGKVRQDEDVDLLVDVNVQGTLNALRFAAARSGKIVFPSSYVYSANAPQPVREDDPTASLDPYSFSKWLAEQAILSWPQFFNVSGVIFRIFNAYGPGQSDRFLIPHALEGFRAGSIRLKDFTSRRDFVYVEDLADLIVRGALASQPDIQIVNAGSGVGHSVLEVLETIFEVLGTRVRIENRNLPVQVPETVACIDRARDLFGWTPSTSLREGIARVAVDKGLLGALRAEVVRFRTK